MTRLQSITILEDLVTPEHTPCKIILNTTSFRHSGIDKQAPNDINISINLPNYLWEGNSLRYQRV